ncbi:hypothetical protein Tco_0966565 [Tanacetum coccineum]
MFNDGVRSDSYSFNQRPIENNNGFNCGSYVSYKVSSCSRSEINKLQKRVGNVNSVVNDVVNDVNCVNEFSAVDELDRSSWDDIQTPERTKKAKTSGFPVASMQIHLAAFNV